MNNPSPLTLLHDLRISGDDPALRPRWPRVAANPPRAADVSIGKPFFQDECSAQEQRLRAAHGQIVDRAMHRQRADVSARKEQWLHHKGVGGESRALPFTLTIA